MVLESTIICMDNSDYQRNGDYVPDRLHAQKDAINLLIRAKLRANPENNVGLMTIADTIDVLTTLTANSGHIYTKMHRVQPKGELHMITGINIAHLVLKHRQGRNHKMRIVAFIGSPIVNDEADLVKLAKRLKKEKVYVDIVSFGGHKDNDPLLLTFIETLNGKDKPAGSHLLSVPRGAMLSEALLASPIIRGENSSGGAAMNGVGFEFGVDPEEDPELALALRISMQEQRAIQEAQARRAAAGAAANGVASTSAAAVLAPGATDPIDYSANEDEEMLQRALVMSLQTQSRENTMPDFANMSEEEQIEFAMQMSMADDDIPIPMEAYTMPSGSPPISSQSMDVDEAYEESLHDLLESLPGIDPESEEVRNAIAALTEERNKEQEKEAEKDDKKKKK